MRKLTEVLCTYWFVEAGNINSSAHHAGLLFGVLGSRLSRQFLLLLTVIVIQYVMDMGSGIH